MKVTFIGLGIMGSRMAKNLLKHQVDLTVFNRSAAPMEALKNTGAKIASSCKEAVQGADVVITMLSAPQVVEEVAWGDNDFLSSMQKDALWIDCSTVNPSFTETSFQEAQKHSIQFLSAPVAGTKPQAEQAELVFFVGGTTNNLEKGKILLEKMGKKIMPIGEEISAGSKFKMLVNSLLAQSMLIFSETVLLGEKMGLDKNFLLDTLPNLVVSAPFTKAKAEMIRTEDYEVQFPLELMHKDMQLVSLTAYEQEQPLYLANVAKEVFAAAKNAGLGREDFAAIFKHLDKS